MACDRSASRGTAFVDAIRQGVRRYPAGNISAGQSGETGGFSHDLEESIDKIYSEETPSF